MGLVVYNTLSRKKEEFKPINEGIVKMYTCGPTIYNYIHIGNLRTFLFEDILVRYLCFRGYEVQQIMNLTDVDDKTIKGAREQNVSLKDFTKPYEKAFFNDIETLNITPAYKYPKATEHIQEMVDMVQSLLDKGFAYKADNSIYFSIETFNQYGKLSHLDKDRLIAGMGGRVSSDEYEKENVSDFVLWKGYTQADGDVYWETPLGKGRPGWHIECSAMSMKYLGETFDIHTGGVDNIFPHHENEIAQSECSTGKPFVRYWMHSEFLTFGEKMSKSLGNVIYLKDLIDKGFSPQAIRYALISSHYRMPLNFSDDLIKQSQAAINRLQDLITRLLSIPKDKPEGTFIEKWIEETLDEFIENMDDDLNISPAMAAVFDFVRKINSNFDALGYNSAQQTLDFLKKINEVLAVLSFESDQLDPEIMDRIKKREEARKKKNFAVADAIRDELLDMGIEIKDTKEGVQWKRIK